METKTKTQKTNKDTIHQNYSTQQETQNIESHQPLRKPATEKPERAKGSTVVDQKVRPVLHPTEMVDSRTKSDKHDETFEQTRPSLDQASLALQQTEYSTISTEVTAERQKFVRKS